MGKEKKNLTIAFNVEDIEELKSLSVDSGVNILSTYCRMVLVDHIKNEKLKKGLKNVR